LQRAELCLNDVLLNQNVCHLLVFKPSGNVTRSLKTFTLHESGTLKNCGYITKALTQRWESCLKREMQKCNRAYFFSLTFTKA